MKALKTVAVALGVTLGALIVIPLAVLAGLFVWLKLTEEDDEEALESRAGRILIDAPPPAASPPAGTAAQRSTPADEAGVPVSVPGRQLSGGPRRPSAAARRPTGTPRERRLAELGVLAAVGIWSANFVVVKSSIEALGPLTFTSIRYLIATATLFALVRWRLGPVRPPARVALTLMGLGMMGFGAYQVLWTLGLTQITAGDSALIIAASPVLTVLLAGAVGMDRLTAPKVAGALVAFTGVAVVVAAGHELSLGASLAGDLLTLGAAVLWAIYTVAGTGMLRRVDPLQATAWAVFGGTLFLLPFGAWNLATSPPSAVPAGAVVGLVYSGMFAAAIANVLVFNAIRLAGPARVTVSQFLVPAGAVVLGAVLLSEPVGVAQVVGGVVIVLGVWLTRRPTVLPAGARARAASGG